RCLFFSVHSNSRHLHSFPTRRSSDLAAALGDTNMDWSRIGRAFVAMDVDSLKLAFDAWPNFDRRYFDQTEQVYQRWLSEMREAGDRKSTRLNSSHQIISYAVFCLKKK